MIVIILDDKFVFKSREKIIKTWIDDVLRTS